MRTPLGIGLVVGAVILLTLLALVHLTFNPRRTGRWLWLIVIVVLPVLGPLLYAVAGSRADPEDWDDLADYRAEHAPPAVEPAAPAPAIPDAAPTLADVYRDEIAAPALASPFRHELPPEADVPVEELAYDDNEAASDFTVRDDGTNLPDFAVRDASAPLTDDVPNASAYDALDAPFEDGSDETLDVLAQTEDAPVEVVHVEDPIEAAPISDEANEATAETLSDDAEDATAAPLPAPEPRRDHLRARRRKPR